MNYFRKLNLKVLTVTFTSLIALNLMTIAKADQLISSDGFDIHYNAFNSSMLSPKIAHQYGIKRSSSLGLINISVIDESNKAFEAYLEGTAKNPISQLTTLDFKKVNEGKAIYYIATFNFADQEYLSFDITVVPDGIKHKIKLNFTQQFFTE